jgi:hypothetical protein
MRREAAIRFDGDCAAPNMGTLNLGTPNMLAPNMGTME